MIPTALCIAGSRFAPSIGRDAWWRASWRRPLGYLQPDPPSQGLGKEIRLSSCRDRLVDRRSSANNTVLMSLGAPKGSGTIARGSNRGHEPSPRPPLYQHFGLSRRARTRPGCGRRRAPWRLSADRPAGPTTQFHGCINTGHSIIHAGKYILTGFNYLGASTAERSTKL